MELFPFSSLKDCPRAFRISMAYMLPHIVNQRNETSSRNRTSEKAIDVARLRQAEIKNQSQNNQDSPNMSVMYPHFHPFSCDLRIS